MWKVGNAQAESIEDMQSKIESMQSDIEYCKDYAITEDTIYDYIDDSDTVSSHEGKIEELERDYNSLDEHFVMVEDFDSYFYDAIEDYLDEN